MRGLNGHNLFLGLLALLGLAVLFTMDPSGTEEQQRRLAAERQNATHLYQSAGDFARFMQPPAETRSTHTASAYHYFPGHEEPLITASDIDQALQKSPTAAGIKKEIEETESKEEVQE